MNERTTPYVYVVLSSSSSSSCGLREFCVWGVGGVDYTTERRKSERILFFVERPTNIFHFSYV